MNNPSGTLSVGYVRAVRGFQNLLFEIVFSVAPMLIELSMGSVILSRKFGPKYSAVVVATFALYIFYTVAVTQWKINIRTKVVEVIHDYLTHVYYKPSLWRCQPVASVALDLSHRSAMGRSISRLGQCE